MDLLYDNIFHPFSFRWSLIEIFSLVASLLAFHYTTANVIYDAVRVVAIYTAVH